MKNIFLPFSLGILLAFSAGPAFLIDQKLEWPKKPITVYVGWSAGGTSDVITRAVTLEMEKKLGKKILVMNVTGALGAIGATQVARAPADGYLLFGGAGVHGTWPILGHSAVSWTDFYAFLGVVFSTTIYVLKDAPWTNLPELIADIQTSSKGQFKYGHPGAGSNGDIFAGLVLDGAAVKEKVISIPYKGGREAGRYLISGETQFASVSAGDLIDWAVAGLIRPLANLYHKEMVFEGIKFPSVLDNFPELEPYQAINPYMGLYVSRNTPPGIVTRIAETFIYAIQQSNFQKLVIKERAGILLPKLGSASDEQMSKIQSARGWALFDLGLALNNPQKFGVPKLRQWSWPPNQQSAELRSWPEAVEILYQQLLQ
jgi:tripartite-type tricarboxylate transporter receptor subunit TctC